MSDQTPPFSLRFAVTLFGALILVPLAAPYSWHWMHWVALLPMFWVVRADTPRHNRWLGALYGFVSVAALFSWLVNTVTLFSNLPFIVAVLVLFAFAAVFGIWPYAVLWGLVHPLRERLGGFWPLGVAALQVVIEFVAMKVMLFPYNHGVSQHAFPLTWQLTSITGIWGLTFLVFFVNASFAEAIYRQREGRDFPVLQWCAAITALSLSILYGAWRWESIEATLRAAPKIRVAQIQSNKTMVYRLETGARVAFEEWLAETKAIPRDAVDLVVWPEGACPYHLNAGRAGKLLAGLAKNGNFELVVGAGTRERKRDPLDGTMDVALFNSVYMYTRGGEEVGHYDKMVPLPFGEYLPFAETFPWLRDIIQGPGRFRAGEEPTILAGEDQIRIAPPICYEAILPGVCRRFVEPDLLINVTNDAWFGDTAAPHQHAMLATTRATELGVPLIRSAYAGVSMVVEPHGHIYAETAPFTRVNRVVTVRVARIDTIYQRFGDWFAWLCAVVLFGSAVVAPWRRRTSPTD